MAAAKKKKYSRESNPGHSRERALRCIPVKNPEVTEIVDDDGELRLVYQVQVRSLFHGVMKRITGSGKTVIDRKLQLDVLGASVWGMIDGRKTVRDIIAEFQALHQLHSREAEISVTSFFKELGRRGLLAMRERE
jgi:hypothetical protein